MTVATRDGGDVRLHYEIRHYPSSRDRLVSAPHISDGKHSCISSSDDEEGDETDIGGWDIVVVEFKGMLSAREEDIE